MNFRVPQDLNSSPLHQTPVIFLYSIDVFINKSHIQVNFLIRSFQKKAWIMFVCILCLICILDIWNYNFFTITKIFSHLSRSPIGHGWSLIYSEILLSEHVVLFFLKLNWCIEIMLMSNHKLLVLLKRLNNF